MELLRTFFARARSFRWKERIRGFFERDKELMDISPRRDWFMIVIVSILLSVGGVFAGFFLLVAISGDSDPFFNEGENVSGGILRQDDLQAAVKLYREKESRLETLLMTDPRPVDPSL